MICVRLNGGLGNQMFQYAFARQLSLKHSTELVLDLTQLKSNTLRNDVTHRNFDLQLFPIKAGIATLGQINQMRSLWKRILNVASIKLRSRAIQTPSYFTENGFSYNNKVEKIGSTCFLMGYWQSEKYFKDAEDTIRKDFEFPPFEGDNISIAEDIKNKNSVSIHIRRGDFAASYTNHVHGILPINYYHAAVAYINKKVSNATYYIFSDDIEWAKGNLPLSNNEVVFVSGNRNDKSYVDMQLMALCKHNIIANSSFSWWGAWLNNYAGKIVIAPQLWFADEKLNKQTTDLIPSTWIRL